MWLKWLPWKYLARRAARSYGFVDPIGLLSHLERFAQPSEVAVPLELLRAGAIFHTRGFINSRVIQQNLDWIWPAWVHQQFNPRSGSFIPRAFSLTHVNLTNRNWTAVGLPDCDSLPIVDPHGLVTPFWDGWSLDAWVIDEKETLLAPSRLDSVDQHLDIADTLAVQTSSRHPGLELGSRAEVVEKDGLVCMLSWRAKSSSRAWLVVSARPYNPEGISFIHTVDLDRSQKSWTINDKERVQFDDPIDVHAVSDYVHGDVARRLFAPDRAASARCDVGMATAAAAFEVPAGQSREIKVRVPLGGGKHRVAKKRAHRLPTWADSLGSACALKVPDQRMQSLYDAALRTLILHSPGDVYPGPYTYKRFWFRDAVFILQAMLCAGLTHRAERVIAGFFKRQTSDGYFLSQEGEWDSNGQVLWLLQRFCELTGRNPNRQWLAPIRRAWRWIAAKRVSDKSSTAHAGLMPAGFSAEHFGPNDYYYWDDFWSVAGLRAAAELLRSLDRPMEAGPCDTEAADLEQAIEESLAQARDRLGHNAMPASCHRRLDSGAIGSLAAGYPLQVFSSGDPRLFRTADYLMEHCTVDGGFFQDMIHSGINVYLTLHLAQVFLRAGDRRFEDLVVAVRDLASPTGQWPEAIHPQTKRGCMGDGQHVWAAAEWIMMLRNCLLYEETHTDRLVLGAGIPRRWTERPTTISIGPAPTSWGPAHVSFDVGPEGVTIQLEGQWYRDPPEVEVRLPGAEPVIVPGQRGRCIVQQGSVADS